jgi:sugar phosphate permease
MKKPRIFYGWWIVVAAFGVIFINAGIGFYSFGVLLKPIMDDFGWTRAQTSLGTALASLMAGFAAIVIGKLVDKFGARKIVFTGAIVGSGLFFLLTTVTSLWQFYAIFLIQGVFLGAFAGFMPVLTAVSRWFVKKQGRAMGIATSGMAVGSLVISPVIGYIVASFGWRAGAIFNGITVLAVDVPLALLILKDKPQDMGLLPDNASSEIKTEEKSFEIRNTALSDNNCPEKPKLSSYLRSPAIWLLSLCLLIAACAAVGLVIHEVPYLTDIGISATLAATILGITGSIGGLGNIVLGYVTERISVRYVLIVVCTIQAIGILILLKSSSIGMVWLFVAVFGFTFGTFPALIPLSIIVLFPLSLFGLVYGFTNFLYQIGIFLGPPLAGQLYDKTGSYSAAFLLFIIMLLIAAVLAYFTWGRNPKHFWLHKSKRSV